MIRLLIVGGIPFVAMHRYAPIFNLPAFSIVSVDPLKWLTVHFLFSSSRRRRRRSFRPVNGGKFVSATEEEQQQ